MLKPQQICKNPPQIAELELPNANPFIPFKLSVAQKEEPQVGAPRFNVHFLSIMVDIPNRCFGRTQNLVLQRHDLPRTEDVHQL